MKLAAPSWPFDHILRLTRMSGLTAELLALRKGLKLLVDRKEPIECWKLKVNACHVVQLVLDIYGK